MRANRLEPPNRNEFAQEGGLSIVLSVLWPARAGNAARSDQAFPADVNLHALPGNARRPLLFALVKRN